MHYMMLMYETQADFEARSNQHKETFWGAWRAYHKALVDAGVYVGGEALEPAAAATTLSLRGGNRNVQDGPFADTKEQLGGFLIVNVPSLDQALDWAARCPAAAAGYVEVRPLLAR